MLNVQFTPTMAFEPYANQTNLHPFVVMPLPTFIFVQAMSMGHVVTFLERCMSGYSVDYGVGFQMCFQLKCAYRVDVAQI